MANILFFDEGHRYEVNGQPFPSVSEILRFLSREIYQDINQYRLDNAASRGTKAHKACEVLDKYGEVETTADIEPYVRAYIQFRREHKCEWTGIEKTTCHQALQYAGTIDRIGTLDGAPAILDLKAQDSVKKPLVKAQLNGYRLAERERVSGTDYALYCLQLMSTGKHRLYPVEADESSFLAAHTLHMALKEKSRRGKI